MLKKVFYSALSALLMVSMFAGTSFADTKTQKANSQVIYTAKEIKDTHKLFEKAINGVTDLAKEELPKFVAQEAVLKARSKSKNINQEDKSKEIKVQSTTQLLKVEKKGDAEVKSYVTNTFAAPTEQQLASSDSGSKYDSSYSVIARSTVYYTISYNNGRKYYDMSRVSGSWSILDNSVTVGGYRVLYGQTGINKSGYSVTQKSNYKYPGGAFTYYTPSSWQPIWANDSYVHSIGVTTRCAIERRGSSWTLTFYNNI
ncbi:hypothetical protein LG329_19680 (plasmid) [Virgibacillus necropolis]|uniref:hypothetical protein n=1 Tax=Virgibacillus necropolis TaxID=163877 RepID=UPI0038509F14